MSVDLVGSTAYKAKFENMAAGQASPVWVQEFRTFYQEFPRLVESKYNGDLDAPYDKLGPMVWKTIGDEIIFCCRVHDIEHLAQCVTAFLRALEAYGTLLEKRGPLNVKGSGWVAAFPAPNISIEVFGHENVASPRNDNAKSFEAPHVQQSESFERRADQHPHKFDFLGKGIDTGFRVAKNASAERFTASVQLGYLLAKASCEQKFSYPFGYHGREILKGVNGDRPYPVISVDTERNNKRRELRDRERALTQQPYVTALALADFLTSFMSNDNIELPHIHFRGAAIPHDEPSSYSNFKQAWHNNVAEAAKRQSSEDKAAEIEDGGGTDIPSELSDFTDEVASQLDERTGA